MPHPPSPGVSVHRPVIRNIHLNLNTFLFTSPISKNYEQVWTRLNSAIVRRKISEVGWLFFFSTQQQKNIDLVVSKLWLRVINK